MTTLATVVKRREKVPSLSFLSEMVGEKECCVVVVWSGWQEEEEEEEAGISGSPSVFCSQASNRLAIPRKKERDNWGHTKAVLRVYI